MRISVLVFALIMITGCSFFEPDNDLYPESKTDLRIINKVNEDIELEIIHHSDTLTSVVAAGSENDFQKYLVGPQKISIKNNEALLDTVEKAFLEYGRPSTLYIVEATDGASVLLLHHKKSYSDTSSYLRFVNADTLYPSVDIYYSQDSYEVINDSIFYTSNSEYLGDTTPVYSNIPSGEAVDYNYVLGNQPLSIIVTEFDKPQNVVIDATVENKATESKTFIISSEGISTYVDQY